MMRIAAAAYNMDVLPDWAAFDTKVEDWVSRAQADLLVFPEYGAMELATLAGLDVAGDLEQSLHAVSERMVRATEVFQAAAKRHGCHILMPSAPVFNGRARPVNRSILVGPEGVLGHQDKQVMTRFERETWNVVGGDPLRVFDVQGVTVGVIICYDAEFPQLARALVEKGVQVLLAPSCTEGLAGYWRVRIGAMARALEGQCVVAHAPTVGTCNWSPAVDENTGAAAIYGPPDSGFPATGVIAEGGLNCPGWVRAEIQTDAIAHVRKEGQVLNATHWLEASEQANRE